MNPHEQEHKELLSSAMKGRWPEVINIYKHDPTAHTAKITMTGDTVLHMAICEKQEDTVKKLVSSIVDAKTPHALDIKNELGYTPLHLAAYIGSVEMCDCIARQGYTLMGIRGENGETPLFRAVVHGRTEAFLCMHRFLCQNEVKAFQYCIRTDGSTILHSAISAEHFDLAYRIIHLYPKLQFRFDVRGFTPLHILASKPSAFRSGSRMGLLHKLIYNSVHVKKLNYDPQNVSPSSSSQGMNITHAPRGRNPQQIDDENPNAQQLDHEKAMVPENYYTCFLCLKFIFKAIELILGSGLIQKRKIREEKEKHTWAIQIMEKLIKYEHAIGSSYPQLSKRGRETDKFNPISGDQRKKGIGLDNKTTELKPPVNDEKKETLLLLAAKHGITEIVEKILETYPLAIHDENSDGKNIVLLAVENRQPEMYQFLKDRNVLNEIIFYKRDKNGNSALHLAATPPANKNNWLIPGPALQMQWEIKWYQFVEESMPDNFFVRHNYKQQTPWDIFSESHEALVKDASDWLYKTSESCSVVAVLIATVAFTASTTIPGGVNSTDGSPVLAKQPGFTIFAISMLVALCFSIASVVMFMVFFTSRHREKDFGRDLPTKLLVELTSLLISIAAVLVSFYAAHFFVIKDSFKYTAILLYAATLLPVTFYAARQIPVYMKLAVATWKKMPERIYDND